MHITGLSWRYLFWQIANIADVNSDDLHNYHTYINSNYQYFVQRIQRIKLQAKQKAVIPNSAKHNKANKQQKIIHILQTVNQQLSTFNTIHQSTVWKVTEFLKYKNTAQVLN